MANRVLLLWLEGPMQSWGTRSRWDVRDTGLRPTKSGVIGLIGCAMGLNRNDSELERLDRDILFGVRIDRPGIVSTDYHTVTGYHRTAGGEFKHSSGIAKSLARAQKYEESTIVSSRDYLYDAIFLVGLEASPEQTESLRYAFNAPCWPIYLGRKSCLPVRPLLDDMAEFNDLETALRCHLRHPMAQKGKLPIYIEDMAGDLEQQDGLRLNELRMYEYHRYHYLEVDPPCISLS